MQEGSQEKWTKESTHNTTQLTTQAHQKYVWRKKNKKKKKEKWKKRRKTERDKDKPEEEGKQKKNKKEEEEEEDNAIGPLNRKNTKAEKRNIPRVRAPDGDNVHGFFSRIFLQPLHLRQVVNIVQQRGHLCV